MHLHFDLENLLLEIYFNERIECLSNNCSFLFYMYGHVASIYEFACTLHVCLESTEAK